MYFAPGTSGNFTLTRLVYLALDGLVSFSYVPLRVITMLGLAVSFVSLVLARICPTAHVGHGQGGAGHQG